MAGVKFELDISTLLDPQQIIRRMREELGVSAPITTFLWKIPPKDVTMYDCEFPVEGLGENVAAWITVSAANVPSLLLESLSESFDILGLTGPSPYVEVEFILSDYDDYYLESCLQVLRLMGLILRLVDGDSFARRENSAYCQLIRKNGDVIIDTSAMTWREEEKQAIGVSFTIDKIPELS